MPNHRTTQHHCPQCFHIAKPRCFRLGHLVCCGVHNVYHSPYSECVQCEGAARRAQREAQKGKEKDREDGAGNNNNHGKSRVIKKKKSGGKAKDKGLAKRRRGNL